MQFHELMYWAGLVAWVASGVCIGLIGFRNSPWYGPSRSARGKLSPIDTKIAKIAAVLFVFGILFFVVGAVVK